MSTEAIRLLIVDDTQETAHHLCKMFLFEPDIKVVGTASNGQEGVERARQSDPDVILMDICMPVMDGIAATEMIKREHPNVPVVMMSVQTGADYRRRSFEVGAVAYLTKPFTMDHLLDTLRRAHADAEEAS